jgi:hypothetical protein
MLQSQVPRPIKAPVAGGNLTTVSTGSPLSPPPPVNTTWPPTPESPKILVFYIKFLNVRAAKNSLTIR